MGLSWLLPGLFCFHHSVTIPLVDCLTRGWHWHPTTSGPNQTNPLCASSRVVLIQQQMVQTKPAHFFVPTAMLSPSKRWSRPKTVCFISIAPVKQQAAQPYFGLASCIIHSFHCWCLVSIVWSGPHFTHQKVVLTHLSLLCSNSIAPFLSCNKQPSLIQSGFICCYPSIYCIVSIVWIGLLTFHLPTGGPNLTQSTSFQH